MSNPTPRRAAPAAPAPTRRRTRREWPYRTAVVALLLAGIVVTLFPVFGTYYNNWHQVHYANQQAAAQKAGVADGTNARWLAGAHAYNNALPAGEVSDPWAGRDQSENPAYQAYLQQLNETQAMARLRIPTINVTLPVYHGTSDAVLAIGAGHMYGTSLPVGGPGTHAALAAHRGEATMTGFDNLPTLRIGDQFFIDIYGQTLAYRITSIQTVLPTNLKPLARVAGQDKVTLITCTPYGINTYRYLVTGTRMALSQADPKKAAWHQEIDWTIQRWMYLRVGISAATLLVLLVLAVKWPMDDRRRRQRRLARIAAAEAAEAAAPVVSPRRIDPTS